MREENVKTYGRVTYIDPNDDKRINIKQEDLTKYINIYVKIPSRYRDGSTQRYDSILNGYTFKGKNDIYDNTYDEISLLTDSYVNVSYNEIRDGGVIKNGELFGIENIDVSLDSQFFPTVTINFVDVKGYGLMSTMEHNYTSKKQLDSSAFFTALFNFPYPIFTLEIKGYLGTTISYDLNLLDFNTYFDSENGNFKIRVSFIGNLYGVLGDIPMSYLLISPYLGSSKNFEKNSYWTSSFDYYPTLFDFLSSYANLFCGNVIGSETSVENLKKQQEIEKQINALQTIQKEYEYFKETSINSVKGKIFKRNENGAIIIKKDCDFNSDNDYFIYEDERNSNVKGDLSKKIDDINNFTYKGVSTTVLDNFREDIKVDNCKTVAPEDGDSYDVFVLRNVKKNHKAINNEIKRLEASKINEEEIVDDVENVISNTLGIIPNISNIYGIIMSHLSCFMKYFYDKLENINYSGENIEIPSHIKLDVINNKLAPFTSFYDTQQKTYVYPKTIINEKMKEDVIIDDIVNASNKTFTNFSTILRTIENYRVENQPTRRRLTPVFFADYLFMNTKYDYCYKKVFNNDVGPVELIYNIFLNRVKAYISFYDGTSIDKMISTEIDNLNNSLILGDEIKKEIVNFSGYNNIIKEIMDEEKYVNINYGYDNEDKNGLFYRQNNDEIVGTIFLFNEAGEFSIGADNTKGVAESKDEKPWIDDEEDNTPTYDDNNKISCYTNDGCHYINVRIRTSQDSCFAMVRRKGRYFFKDYDKKSTLLFLATQYSRVKLKRGQGQTAYTTSDKFYYDKKVYQYKMHQCACFGESKHEYNISPKDDGKIIINKKNGAIPLGQYDDNNLCQRYYVGIKCHKAMEMFCLAVYELYLQSKSETTNMLTKLSDYFKEKYPSFWQSGSIKQRIIKFFKEIYNIDIDNIDDFLEKSYYMGANFQQYDCSEDQLKYAVNMFQTLYASRNELEIENSLNANERIKKEISFQEDLKNGIYYNMKSLYDKYLSSMYYDNFDEDSVLYNNVKFITPLYNDISNSFINVDRFYSQIKNVIESENSCSVIEFLSKLGQDNELLFLVQPQTPLQDLTQIFKPDKNRINNNSGVTLLYISHCDVSHNVNIENSEYVDDGFSLTDFKNPDGMLDDEVANLISDLHDYNFDAFGVTYGMQNQNIFKTININTENPSTTEHSIANIISISNQGEEVKNHIYTSTKNQLYPIYANRSYTCEVSMLGCMNITPLMIFQLNNIPLFKGAYLIYDVQHHITPSDFTTSFKGVRMSKYKIPISTKYQILSLASIGSVGQNGGTQQGAGGTETTVGTGEPVNIDTSNDTVNLEAGHSCFFGYEHNCDKKKKNPNCNTHGNKECCDCHRSAILSVQCLLNAHNIPDDNSYAYINNSLRLLYEDKDENGNNSLFYFLRDNENQKSKYRVVVDYIKYHLDNKRPVIVGVNHTYGNTINEGTSDHWVTIYAYGDSGGTTYFRYYETGSNQATDEDYDNIFLYTDGEKPLLCNERARPYKKRAQTRRYDVTVVKFWYKTERLGYKLNNYKDENDKSVSKISIYDNK